MDRSYLNMDCQRRGLAAKSLGANAQGVDSLQQLLLHLRIEGIGVGRPGRTQERPLGQLCRAIKAAANAHTHHNGRTGVGTSLCHGLHHKILHALGAIGGAQHGNAAHVLTARALGGHRDLQLVTRYQAGIDTGRGVVLGIHPAQGIRHHRAPETCLQIALADACMNCLLQIPLNMDLLSHLQKDAGNACILANGQLILFCNLIILYNFRQNAPRRFPGLPGLTLGDTGPHILG